MLLFFTISVVLSAQTKAIEIDTLNAKTFIQTMYQNKSLSPKDYKLFAVPLRQNLKREAIFLKRGQASNIDFDLLYGFREIDSCQLISIVKDPNSSKNQYVVTYKNEEKTEEIKILLTKKSPYLIRDIFYNNSLEINGVAHPFSLMNLFKLIDVRNKP
ncbi:MAG: hypothetical protein MUE53_06280 [Chitinophagales bacterium]|nr:hypothetical protein [Chitinophagales bacterium]